MVDAGEWCAARNGGARRIRLFITTDQNLRFQQKLTGRSLAILVLRTTSWPRMQTHIHDIQQAVDATQTGSYRELSFDVTP